MKENVIIATAVIGITLFCYYTGQLAAKAVCYDRKEEKKKKKKRWV